MKRVGEVYIYSIHICTICTHTMEKNCHSTAVTNIFNKSLLLLKSAESQDKKNIF